jgi:prepilin-type N-terminal cleavage/methylation domain-containing protein
MNISKSRVGGFTLVELIVALVVISIISVAVTQMVVGAAETSLYVTNGTDSISQVETAYRRILHNLRTCSQITATTANSLTLQTQNDPNFNNAPRTVTYSVSGGILTEQNVGTSGTTTTTTNSQLVFGVTNFFVTVVNTTTPKTVQIEITAGTSPVVDRTATIYCRNL